MKQAADSVQTLPYDIATASVSPVLPTGLILVFLLAIVQAPFSLQRVLASLKSLNPRAVAASSGVASDTVDSSIGSKSSGVSKTSAARREEVARHLRETLAKRLDVWIRESGLPYKVFLYSYLGLSALLLLGGIGGLARWSLGAKIVIGACIAGIILEIALAIFELRVLAVSWSALDAAARDLNMEAPMDAALAASTRMKIYRLAFSIPLFAFVRLSYLVLAARYLRSHRIREFLSLPRRLVIVETKPQVLQASLADLANLPREPEISPTSPPPQEKASLPGAANAAEHVASSSLPKPRPRDVI
ncbi:MAG: hypothetical protein RIC55_35320 [Pirellulaceae bacterium]